MWRWSTVSCIHWKGRGLLWVCFGGPRNTYCHGRGSDVKVGSEDYLNLGTILARVLLNEGDKPNALIPNFDNARKVAQKELESECVCPNNCYGQFPEDEMYSIQLQMAELEELEHCMHKCPHPASNICQTLNCYFNKDSLPGKCSILKYNLVHKHANLSIF